MFFYNHINNINNTMKTKFFQWVMAATLICGASVFTSCSSDDKDATAQANENRSEFVEHCRENLKNLAENLNFSTWTGINNLNNDFNTNVLNNPAFEKTVSGLFLQQIAQSIQPVAPGSELAEKGYQNYAVIDFTSFNYRFTQNADNTGFDVTPAEDFTLIFKRTEQKDRPAPEEGDIPPVPEGGQPKEDCEALLLKASDTYSEMIAERFSTPQLAVIVRIPTTFEFKMGKLMDDGSINARLTGSFKNEYFGKANSSYIDIKTDSWKISGTLQSNVSGPQDGKGPQDGEGPQDGVRPRESEFSQDRPKDDATTLVFSLSIDKVNQKGDVAVSWEQNGRKMIDLTLKESGVGSSSILNFDFSQFASESIFNIIAALFEGRSLDECKVTLLDDLTTTMSITDMAKAVKLSQECARARRNYADEATIDQYTQQFNELMKAEVTCKGVNQTYPMKLVTTKVGVDWWTMPAFQFAEGSDYMPLVNILDGESIAYMLNIADHAAEPMQQSLITVRQLIQYVQTMVGYLKSQQTQQQGQ